MRDDAVTSRQPNARMALLWAPVVLYMAAIFAGSSMPDPPLPSNAPELPLHEAAYFGLALLLIRALARGTWSGVTAATLIGAWLIAVAYGATDEWHQSFVPSRNAEWTDLRADAIGAFAAAALVRVWDIIRRL